ncbi:hypothetical protein DH2020_012648 [Rehmannia glutinosa]|uniref:Uncharacterized protein n=1 Tax=Rehmannia glutinosa TaxID=99300 RepID=A0ABR0X0N8_REHGL
MSLVLVAGKLEKCHGFGFLKKTDNKDIIFLEGSEKDISKVRDFDKHHAEELEKIELNLKFKFPTFEEFSRIQKGKCSLFNSEVVPYTSTSKHEFISGESSLSAVSNELATFPLTEINGSDFSKGEEIFVQREGEVIVGFDGGQNGKTEFLDESQFCSEEKSDCFLSDGDFGDTNGESEKIGLESEKENKACEFLSEKDFSGNVDNENDAGLGLRPSSSLVQRSEVRFSSHDMHLEKEKESVAEFLHIGVKIGDDSEKPNSENKPKNSITTDCGNDANKLESLWEHQELIEQLRMELRKVRATGLPTILEESESPKMTDDLKPWKIDENFQHEDCIGELHKLYKSYTEMMRKFDILNYQKMYAMGFLQLKDPFQSAPQQKPSAPTLKSSFLKTFGCSNTKAMAYDKALDLWNSDPDGIHRYNEVAGEFQQFQVLMQRFTEDEPFQGPRVQNYVKSRCVLRNLLQVPLIREDYLKGKNKGKTKDTYEYVFTSEMLVEMVEESIRIFWRFVRSDKDCFSVAINAHKKLPELHNSEDLKLLLEKEKKLKDLLRSENCILRKFQQNREDDWDQVLYFFAQVDMKLVSRVFNMSKITRDQLIWCRSKLSKISFVNRKIHVEPAFLLFPCN